jgi:hypothetical protein
MDGSGCEGVVFKGQLFDGAAVLQQHILPAMLSTRLVQSTQWRAYSWSITANTTHRQCAQWALRLQLLLLLLLLPSMSLQFAMLLNKKTERIQALTDTVQEQARQMEQLQVSVTQLSPHNWVCRCMSCFLII